ncbi:MAG: acyltransferase [Pseudomonadota bacterium]
MQQLKSIQALRALAALAVMLAHLYGVENKHSGGTPILSDAALTGVSGVDLFFVISGFIMVWIAGNLEPGLRTSGKFMFARVMRIYPVWWLFAGAMSVYLFISYGAPWDAEALEQLNIGGWPHWVNSMLLIPHEALPVLQVGWTLIHEMYFYLVFAALLLLPATYRIPALIFWAIVILGSISLQLTSFYANSFFSLIFFPMTLEFLFGAAAAFALKASAGRFRWAAFIIGVVWLIVAIVTVDFSEALASAPTQRTFAYGPAFALLVYAAVALEQHARLGDFIPHWLVRIGDWSYSLYLCHLLVISAFARLFYPRFASAGMFDNLLFLGFAASAAILVSALSFYLFERPVLSISRIARNRWFGQTPSQRDPLQAPNSPDISENSRAS